MRGRLHKVLMAMVAAALCSAPLRGEAQQTPIEVETDPWVEIHVTPTETVLLPGEPPRLIVEVSARPYPGSEIAINRSERFWITPEGGGRQEFLLMHAGAMVIPRHGAISVRDYDPQPLNVYLYPRPDRDLDPRSDWDIWPTRPTFAFTTPGRYTLQVGLQTAYVRSDPLYRGLPAGADRGEDVHVTPVLLANPVEFTIAEPPPSEQDPSRFVLSNGWFSGSVRGDIDWHGSSLGWPPVEDLRVFIDRFPGSRYADHARLRVAFVRLHSIVGGSPASFNRYTPLPRDVLEEIARLLEGIRCDGFSRADEALQWLALVEYQLGREAEARAACDRLLALPYASPCKIAWERVMTGRAGAPLGE